MNIHEHVQAHEPTGCSFHIVEFCLLATNFRQALPTLTASVPLSHVTVGQARRAHSRALLLRRGRLSTHDLTWEQLQALGCCGKNLSLKSRLWQK